MSMLSSISGFFAGLASITWEHISELLGWFPLTFQSQRDYRDLPVGPDAQIPQFEEED
jgi:hypothetical protein